MLTALLWISVITLLIGSFVALEVALSECRLESVCAPDKVELRTGLISTEDYLIASRIVSHGLLLVVGVLAWRLWDSAIGAGGLLDGQSSMVQGVAFLSAGLLMLFALAIIGFWLPTKIAERFPEKTVSLLAPIGKVITIASAPLVRVVRASGAIITPSGVVPEMIEEEELEEDIRSLVEEGEKAGVIEEEEKKIITRVFALGDKPVASLMTHRSDVVTFSSSMSPDEALAVAIQSRLTWFPVVGATQDDILGIVSIHDVVTARQSPQDFPLGLKQLVSSPLEVPESMTALELFEMFKSGGGHFAVVRDEYGSVAGIATVDDVLKVIVGELGDSSDGERSIVRREDGSWLVDASSDIDNLFEVLGIDELRGEEQGSFHSVGGFIMTSLGRIPREGDTFACDGFRFEVVDMDGKRIDKVLVYRDASSAVVGE